jgi:UDP-N-acetylmuramoyl-L-alanyl-D-glutamate--2,6-diaminopimelate ligase
MLSIVNNYGFNIEDIINKTHLLKAPKGRCEAYKVNNGYAVIDYAHTPDAVEKVITAYNELKKNKVITIIGCGGDRDPKKRPIMGDIATKLSDYVIFTNDNPRTEDPNNIMNDILKGVKSNNYEVILDRKLAIKKGIDMMNKDDILLILGKGHEEFIIVKDQKIPHNDMKVVKEIIEEDNTSN